jgi:hypothetical protein
VDAAAFHSGSEEVISPELVLVDPELAQIARRRLHVPPEWRPPPGPATSPTVAVAPASTHTFTPVESRRNVRRSTRVLGALATGIPLLLFGAVVVGMVASEVRAQFVDGPATLVAPSTPAVSASADPGAGRWVPTRSDVEARTLVVLRQGVLVSVPPALIDKTTGSLANNVHVSCQRIGPPSQFSCKVTSGRSSPGRAWLLDVVATRDGGEWAWVGPAAAIGDG